MTHSPDSNITMPVGDDVTLFGERIYFNDWAESGEEGMLNDFGISKAALDGCKVLVASYSYEDYKGDAYVLFERDGELFEIHGGHCSCYGLSERGYGSGGTQTQWQPEEVTEEAIRHRLDNGTWGEDARIKDHVRRALDRRRSGAI